MKRIALVASILLALAVTLGMSASPVRAARPKPTPTPSASPSALPTATPEPPEVAIPRLEAKLKADPKDQNTMLQLAGQYLTIGRADLSLPLTQKLLQLGNKSAQTYYIDGAGLESINNLQGAVSDFENASNLDPTNLGVLQQLSGVYTRLNRFPDAERIAKRAITFNKDQPDAYVTLGNVYASEQKFDDARAQYDLALKIDPKNTQALYQIAQTYSGQNNIDKAVTAIDRVLMIDPSDTQALMFKAQLFASEHDDQKTSAAYDDAVVAATTDDEKVSILLRKALYFVDEKKNDQAETIFKNAAQQYPKIAQAHVAYGEYLGQANRVPEAIQEFNAALAIEKDDPGALFDLATIAMNQRKVTDAIGYLKRYTGVQQDPKGFAMLGQAYASVRDYVHARDACGKAFALARSPDLLTCVATADYNLHNYKEAAQIFDAIDSGARAYLDQNPALLFLAGKSYAANHEKSKALAEYNRLLPLTRKGTKPYQQVQQAIADLNKPERPPKGH